MGRGPRAAALLAAGVLLAFASPARADHPLPTDPAVIEGSLRNGMRYIVRPTGDGNPVTARLLIPAGAVHEPEASSGLAQVAHLLVEARMRRDAPEGLDLGGYITLDAAHFIARIESPDDALLDEALDRLAGALAPARFDETTVLRQRSAAAARRTNFNNPDARVQRRLLARLGLERIASRLPSPTIDEAAVTPDSVARFHEDRYGAASAAVVVAGGVEPAQAIGRIERAFADLPAREAPALAWSPSPYESPFAAVVVEPALTDCDVDIVAVAPEAAPARTVEAFRRELVREVALRALARRLEAAGATGAPFDDAKAHTVDIAGMARLHNVFVSGPPASWEAMLSALVGEVRRLSAHGFSPLEAQRAGDALLADLRRRSAGDAPESPDRIAARLAFAAASGRPLMRPEQRLGLSESLLRGVLAGEATDAVAEMFHPGRIAYALTLPPASDGSVPDPARVLDAARADERVYEAAAALLHRVSIPDPPAEGGEVVSMRLHPDAGVLTARLSNNALVHHRRMDDPSGAVHITLTLVGGRIEETSRTRGLTDAAAAALVRPATNRLTSVQVRDLFSRAGATVQTRLLDDALTLRMEVPPERLDTALRTLYAVLSDARMEAPGLDAWRRARLREAGDRAEQPYDALREALPRTLFEEGEPRVRPLSREEIKRIDLRRAQAWLDRLLDEAPIEIGVAGPVDAEPLLRALASTIGALPSREPVAPDALDHLRRARRAAPPYKADIALDSDSAQAVILLARVLGVDAEDDDLRRRGELLEIAAEAFELRLERLGRGRPGLVYAMHADSSTGGVYRGFGLVYALAVVTRDRLEEFTDLLEREWASFLERGPDDELLLQARDEMAQNAAADLLDAGEWAEELSRLRQRAGDLDAMLGAPERIESYALQDIRAALLRGAEQGEPLRIIIRAGGPHRADRD